MNEAATVARVTDALLGVDLKGHETTMLCVSTAMIPEHTDAALRAGITDIFSWPWSDDGWTIYVGDADALMETLSPIHLELAALIEFASARGYPWLRISAVDDPLPPACGFKEFNW